MSSEVERMGKKLSTQERRRRAYLKMLPDDGREAFLAAEFYWRASANAVAKILYRPIIYTYKVI